VLKLHPNALVGIRINRKTLSTDVVQSICAFVFLYVAFFFAMSIIISLDNHDMLTNLSATAACLGNIGPGLGDVGPVNNFGFFSDGSKFLLSLTMIAGRLELFTLLMMLTGRFWNPNE
jgi:trk system potassium uptake protein TrkH